LDGHLGMVCSLSSRDSRYLVSGSWDATAIIWDLSTSSVLHRLEGHKYGVAVLATNDPDEILTGS
jgi:phospholipase A-2-activating protein